MAKVVAHEAFHRQHPLASLKAESFGDAELLGPIEQVAGGAGVKMHLITESKQKQPRGEQSAMIKLREGSEQVQAIRVRCAMLGKSQPAQQIQIAQAPARAFHVWLQ